MKNIKLLLLENVPKLGKKGNIVSVRPGYGRNYLIPKSLAAVATKENLRLLEIQKKRHMQMEAEKKEQVRLVAKELELTGCTLEAKANEEGHLFGSVTYAMIAEGFQEIGFEIKAEDIELIDPKLYPIKELGIFAVQIRLHPEITAKSKVWVVNEQESGE